MGGTRGILGISKGLILMVVFPGDSHFLLHAIVRATKFSSGSKNQCTGTMITNTGNHFLSHHSLIFFLLLWGLVFFSFLTFLYTLLLNSPHPYCVPHAPHN